MADPNPSPVCLIRNLLIGLSTAGTKLNPPRGRRPRGQPHPLLGACRRNLNCACLCQDGQQCKAASAMIWATFAYIFPIHAEVFLSFVVDRDLMAMSAFALLNNDSILTIHILLNHPS